MRAAAASRLRYPCGNSQTTSRHQDKSQNLPHSVRARQNFRVTKGEKYPKPNQTGEAGRIAPGRSQSDSVSNFLKDINLLLFVLGFLPVITIQHFEIDPEIFLVVLG